MEDIISAMAVDTLLKIQGEVLQARQALIVVNQLLLNFPDATCREIQQQASEIIKKGLGQ